MPERIVFELPERSRHFYARFNCEEEYGRLLAAAPQITDEYEQKRLRAAFNYALHHHADQRRSDGTPYITHPIEVARRIAERGGSYEYIATALLHDVREDSATGIDREEAGRLFTRAVWQNVNILSHKEDENYRQYAGRILSSGNLAAIYIKMTDVLHNLETLGNLDGRKKARKLDDYEQFYHAAARLDSEMAENIRRELEANGRLVRPEIFTERVAVVPSRHGGGEWVSQLPPVDSNAAIVHWPDGEGALEVGLPLTEGVSEADWRARLSRSVISQNQKAGISKIAHAAKLSPRGAGNRVHFVVYFRGLEAEAAVRHVAGLVEDAHRNLFPRYAQGSWRT